MPVEGIEAAAPVATDQPSLLDNPELMALIAQSAASTFGMRLLRDSRDRLKEETDE